MKNTIALSLVVLLTPFISFAAFDRDLQYGSTGSDVKELQELLTTQGHYTGAITGNFYSLTRQAVIKFQLANNLSPAAGYFGPKSRAKANVILAIQDDASNAQAIQETGATSSPVKNDAASILQAQVNALLAQIKLLTSQVKTQTTVQQQTQTTLQQTQQSIQQIQQNTTPTPPSTPPPPPVTVIVQSPPEPSRASDIVINTFGPVPSENTNHSEYPNRYVFQVSVVDQYGVPMKGAQVALVRANNDNVSMSPLFTNMGANGSWYAEFQYRPYQFAADPPHVNVRNVTFTSGSLTKSIQLSI